MNIVAKYEVNTFQLTLLKESQCYLENSNFWCIVGEPHGQKANIKKSRGSEGYRRFDR